MFATRHGCQIEVFSCEDIGCFCGLDVAAVCVFHFYSRTRSRSGRRTLALDVCCRISITLPVSICSAFVHITTDMLAKMLKQHKASLLGNELIQVKCFKADYNTWILMLCIGH